VRIELANRLVTEFMLPRFKGKTPKEITVVDVGCSIGTFAIEFARSGYRSYGIDFDPAALKIARELAQEEKVETDFVCGDISDWGKSFPPIDIAVCFDIFEHLHDDELGACLNAVRRNLSPAGGLVFHTFPTQWDEVFFTKSYISFPLIPFKILPPRVFNSIVKIYASLVDIVLLTTKGVTFREYIKLFSHCNPTTQERLVDIFQRAGFEIVYIETAQLYQLEPRIQKLFARQPISYRNIFGVAVIQNNKD
jgi:SAM-dependent methyltransferase